MPHFFLPEVGAGTVVIEGTGAASDEPPVLLGDDLVGVLPELSDRHISETLSLSGAYEDIRATVLGLSGATLLANLGTAAPDGLAAMVGGLCVRLSRARDTLAGLGNSSHEGIRRRARALLRAAALLDHQIAHLRNHRPLDLSTDTLRTALALLGASSLLEANMIPFGSDSCTESLTTPASDRVILTP